MEKWLFAMVAFAIVGAITPGPVNLLATSIAQNSGPKEATKHVIGASLAYAIVVWLSGSGLTIASQWLPVMLSILPVMATLILVFAAYSLWNAQVDEASINTSGVRWWSGSLLQLLNPKAWLVATSGVSLFVVEHTHPLIALTTFTTISLVACLIGVGSWAFIGQVLSKRLAKSSAASQFNRVMAVFLLVSVGLIWS